MTMSKPILERSGHKSSGNPCGEWKVTVWSHPSIKNRYSYSYSIAGGVLANPCPIDENDPSLFGCYVTPAEALRAGMEDVQS